jgi:Ca2+-binding RTX toxin-like protein
MRSGPKIVTAFGVVLAVGLGAGVRVEASSGSDLTCRGLPVTIEGAVDTHVVGTEGNDVILAHKGNTGSVDGRGGDDVICVVAPSVVPEAPDGPLFTLRDGAGDDVVDSTSLPDWSELHVLWSPGSDTFLGGPENDWVNIADRDAMVDIETDVIITGAGDDYIASGFGGTANGDQVDVGPGDDEVVFYGSAASAQAHVDGGDGYDFLHAVGLATSEAVVFDARTGTATVAGQTYLNWSGVERYNLGAIKHAALTFLGSTSREALELGRDHGSIDVEMGGGDDLVDNYGGLIPPGTIRGGRGHDFLSLGTTSPATLDMSGIGEVFDKDDHPHPLVLAGFEDARIYAPAGATVRGTAADNRLAVDSNRDIFVFAGAGDDRVRVGDLNGGREIDTRRVRGGPGGDRLRGTQHSDILQGGPGRDEVFGNGGRDVCRSAEIRHSCELP